MCGIGIGGIGRGRTVDEQLDLLVCGADTDAEHGKGEMAEIEEVVVVDVVVQGIGRTKDGRRGGGACR